MKGELQLSEQVKFKPKLAISASFKSPVKQGRSSVLPDTEASPHSVSIPE